MYLPHPSKVLMIAGSLLVLRFWSLGICLYVCIASGIRFECKGMAE